MCCHNIQISTLNFTCQQICDMISVQCTYSSIHLLNLYDMLLKIFATIVIADSPMHTVIWQINMLLWKPPKWMPYFLNLAITPNFYYSIQMFHSLAFYDHNTDLFSLKTYINTLQDLNKWTFLLYWVFFNVAF